MHSTAPNGQPSVDLRPVPVSRPRRIGLVLGATAVLMSLTGLGLTAIQHAAVGTSTITAAEAVATPAGTLPAPSGAPLPSLKRILATAGAVAAEGSGLELERSAADHRRDARSGEQD